MFHNIHAVCQHKQHGSQMSAINIRSFYQSLFTSDWFQSYIQHTRIIPTNFCAVRLFPIIICTNSGILWHIGHFTSVTNFISDSQLSQYSYSTTEQEMTKTNESVFLTLPLVEEKSKLCRKLYRIQGLGQRKGHR